MYHLLEIMGSGQAKCCSSFLYNEPTMSLESGQLRDHIDLASSQQILDNPSNVANVLHDFEGYLAFHHNALGVNRLDRRPETARLHMAQDIRRCLQRVVAHRVATSLLPVALDLLSGESQVVDAIENDGTLECEEWEGARYRIFEGDEAKIGAGYEQLFMSAVKDGLFACYTPAQAEALRVANYRATLRVQHEAASVKTAEFSQNALANLIAKEPYVGFDQTSKVQMRLRTTSFLGGTNAPSRVNNSLRPDILHQLETNAVGFGEFYGSACGAMLPYTFRQDGCPPSEWLKAELVSIAPISALAALKDGPAGEIVYTDRAKRAFQVYEQAGLWYIDGVREPLRSTAEKVKGAWAKNLGRAGLMGQIGRCPSNQELSPSPREAAMRAQLIDRIDELTEGHCPKHLREIITPADVCAIAGVGLVAELRRRDIIRLAPQKLEPVLRREPPELRDEYALLSRQLSASDDMIVALL